MGLLKQLIDKSFANLGARVREFVNFSGWKCCVEKFIAL